MDWKRYFDQRIFEGINLDKLEIIDFSQMDEDDLEQARNINGITLSTIVPIDVYFGTTRLDCDYIKLTNGNEARMSTPYRFIHTDGRDYTYKILQSGKGSLTFRVCEEGDMYHNLILDNSSRFIRCIDHSVVTHHPNPHVNGQWMFIKASLGALTTETAMVILLGYSPGHKTEVPHAEGPEKWISIKLGFEVNVEHFKEKFHARWAWIDPEAAVERFLAAYNGAPRPSLPNRHVTLLQGDLRESAPYDEEVTTASTLEVEIDARDIIHGTGNEP